jgi:hypothetical protein
MGTALFIIAIVAFTALFFFFTDRREKRLE